MVHLGVHHLLVLPAVHHPSKHRLIHGVVHLIATLTGMAKELIETLHSLSLLVLLF